MYNFKRKSPLQKAEKRVSPPFTSHNNSTPILEKASQLSQVAMVAIVFFGYIYTVIPVMQKEALAESVASLEKQKNQLEKDLDFFNERIRTTNDSLSKAIQEKRDINQINESLQKNQKEMLSRLESLKLEKKRYQEESDYAKDSYYNLLKEELKSGYLMVLIDKNESMSIFNAPPFMGYKEAPSITESLKNEFYDPQALAERYIQHLEKIQMSSESRIEAEGRKRILEEAKKNLEKYKGYLHCKPVPYDSWQDSYQYAISKIEKEIDRCAEKLTDIYYEKEEMGNVTKWIQKKTTYHSEHISMNKKLCRTNVRADINEFFRNRWEDFKEPCREKFLQVNDVLLGDINIERLNHEMEVSFPLSHEIELEINRSINSKISQ